MSRIATAFYCVIAALTPAFAAEPEAVPVAGYAGEAMEPFISRDGRFLFFNNRNDPAAQTNIHFAEQGAYGFVYRGVLPGTVSNDLDGVPTMSAASRFCFISPREYRRTLTTVFCGSFDGEKIVDAAPQEALASARLGLLVFDVELSADGKTMVMAEGAFSGGAVPDTADLDLATLGPDGFKRTKDGARIFANINTDALEFAPALSVDGLELLFTRITGIAPYLTPAIYRARRSSTAKPFGAPARVAGIDGFVEGPSIAPDGTIYFHKRTANRFGIWRLARKR